MRADPDPRVGFHLVGEHTEEWLAKLREAMTAVDDVRAEGPGL